MEESEPRTDQPVEELPDDWWYRVYFGVVVTTVVVISALWIFSRHFSG
jgi:hypothetical protein